MKRIICLFISLFWLCPLFALADDAGALSESELNEWLVKILRDSAAAQPVNAPVGEESRTEDGYAFIYDFATLYYDKPALDENSVLRAVSVTDEAYAGPRGVKLGNGGDALIATYGWQNPHLMGDGAFAAFYRINSLPRAAYWSWAQYNEDFQLTAVRCAIHVQAGQDRYTDAGVLYSLENGVISSIYIYGLNSLITAAEVKSNLDAVMSVEAAGCGDGPPAGDAAAALSVPANTADAFGRDDLRFAGLDYAVLTPDAAKVALGAPVSETSVPDESGDTYENLKWDGVELIWIRGSDLKNSRADSLRVTAPAVEGPRGLRVGMGLEEAAALFLSEGAPGLLYGSGGSTEYGEISREGGRTLLTYHMAAGAGESGGSYVMQLAFENDTLLEWVLSTSEAQWTL